MCQWIDNNKIGKLYLKKCFIIFKKILYYLILMWYSVWWFLHIFSMSGLMYESLISYSIFVNLSHFLVLMLINVENPNSYKYDVENCNNILIIIFLKIFLNS